MLLAATKLNRLCLYAGLILLLAGFSAPASTNSQWFTRVWQIDDGLLDNSINGVVQGPDGYLWLVTPVGLMQFDGASFSPFPIEDFTGPVASHVRSIFCSKAGVIWMGSDGGALLGLNPNFSTVAVPQKSLPSRVPLAMAEDGDGSLWLGYFSDICRIKGGQVTRFRAQDGVPSGSFHSLKSDGAGNIWLAQGNQISIFQNGLFQPIVKNRAIQSLAAARTNAVWFAAEGHLFACDAEGSLRDCGSFQSSPGSTVMTMLEDDTGAVWIGTDGNGLFRYNGSSFERMDASHSSILSLAEDCEGDIWVGTGGGGLDRIALSGIRLEVLENDQILSQPQSICQDAHGILWGAIQNGNLVCRMGDKWSLIFTNSPFARSVNCVAADSNAVWVGTRAGELFRIVDTNYTLVDTNLTQGVVHGLLPTSKGDLWIVGDNVLQRLHNGQLQDVRLPKKLQKIYALAEDAAGNLWVGANGILLRFDGKKFTDETRPLRISGRPVCCLYGTPDGSVWIGSRGGGLVRFKDGHISRVGIEQGLVNNYISQIVADDCGWLWFGSSHGIFKIRQQELEQALQDRSIILRPILYGKNEGLNSQEAVFSTASPSVLPHAFFDSNGQVWMLMHAGVVVADPKLAAEDAVPPTVLLTQMAVDGQVVAAYGGVSSIQIVPNLKTLNAPLHVPPSHRHLEFDFTAFHFKAPENIHFRYQLAGFDTNWIDANAAHMADYSRLTAGNYQFYAEASVGDGVWSEPAMLSFIVAPFFWQTWWFRFGVLLLFTLSVISIVRYISFRRLRQKLNAIEQQAAVERERGRIARDIHDDLGNRLTEIQLLTGLAERNVAVPEKTIAHVNEISSAARQATDALDEIVWAINPRNDTLPHLINYLGQFTSDFMRRAGIRCRVDLPENPPAKSVSAEVRHNVFLAIKESLNNIVRHANATEVSLFILVTNDSLSVIIEDNGYGFNGEAKNNGVADGLENMRRRIAEVGGEFQIKSKPGVGTRISFNGLWLAKK